MSTDGMTFFYCRPETRAEAKLSTSSGVPACPFCRRSLDSRHVWCERAQTANRAFNELLQRRKRA